MQRKFGKMVNLGRTTGCIHRAVLVKSGRVHNLTNGGGFTLPYPLRGRRKRGRGDRGRVELLRWITL